MYSQYYIRQIFPCLVHQLVQDFQAGGSHRCKSHRQHFWPSEPLVLRLCKSYCVRCSDNISLDLQDTEADSRQSHVSAAECSSGSLSIQCVCGILSRLGKSRLLGVCAGPHLCSSHQQHRLPGQQLVCGAGMDQGVVPGRLCLPCKPQCRWAPPPEGLHDTAAAPCLAYT